MSLELSRRSFMKLSALTAVDVAGSSLLGGCSDSSETLYPSGAFGKKLKLMGEFTVSDPAYDASTNNLTCNFKAKCTSSTSFASGHREEKPKLATVTAISANTPTGA